jgi:flavin reductase (DIM6/NTAB) family NADH-FMN oxidoreductase RutF
MRRVPHPVAIITASDNHSVHASSQDDEKPPLFRGMTVSSFNTVTLHPEPVVSFNVRRPSETLNALQSSGRFLVHLLTPSAATAKLARDFSRGNEHLQLYKQGLGEFEFGALLPASRTTANNKEILPPLPALPILRRNNENGNLAQQQQESVIDFPFIFECEYLPEQTIQIHDHTIVLGSVIRVLEQELQPQQQIISGNSSSQQEQQAGKDSSFCLTYADARFWKTGDEV